MIDDADDPRSASQSNSAKSANPAKPESAHAGARRRAAQARARVVEQTREGWRRGHPRRVTPDRRTRAQIARVAGTPGQSSSAHPAGRCIAALRIDGGTRFVRESDPAAMHLRLGHFVRRLREPRSRDVEFEETREGIVFTLPLPSIAGPDVPAAFLDGWTASPDVHVTVAGTRRQDIRFHAPDECFIQLDAESGRWIVEAKARALYAMGFEAWARRWLALVAWLAHGRAEWNDGWRTTRLELNCDFIGVDFFAADLARFTNTRTTAVHGHQATNDQLTARGSSGWEETLEIGRRSTSDVSLCIYRKSVQLRTDKDVEPAASMYAPLWKANGWTGEEVTRVEIRLAHKGLEFAERDGSGTLSLRSPAALADRTILAKIWAHVTQTKRLAAPDVARRRAASTDPRWIAVQDAAGGAVVDLKRMPEVVAATLRERRAKNAREIRHDLARYGHLHGARIETDDDLEAVARACLDHPPEYDNVLPRRLNLPAATRRARASLGFVRQQLDRDREDFLRRAGSDGESSCRPLFEETPPRRSKSITAEEPES